jgi:hypothetical protein
MWRILVTAVTTAFLYAIAPSLMSTGALTDSAEAAKLKGFSKEQKQAVKKPEKKKN